MITLDQLKTIMPLSEHAAQFLKPLNDAAREFDISTTPRLAAWLANIAVESAQLNVQIENLNYSAEGLRETFPSHFNPDEYAKFAHNPQAIANRVYANRMGNGPESSGDGWKYRGHGLPQLTGKAMFIACGEGLELDLINHPELLLIPENSARCAGWFWHYKNCEDDADHCAFREVARKWNGGLNGIVQRELFYDKAMKVLS